MWYQNYQKSVKFNVAVIVLVKSRMLKNLAFFQICRNVSRSASYYVIMRKHTNEQASDLFRLDEKTDFGCHSHDMSSQPRFGMKIVCCLQWSVIHE